MKISPQSSELIQFLSTLPCVIPEHIWIMMINLSLTSSLAYISDGCTSISATSWCSFLLPIGRHSWNRTWRSTGNFRYQWKWQMGMRYMPYIFDHYLHPNAFAVFISFFPLVSLLILSCTSLNFLNTNYITSCYLTCLNSYSEFMETNTERNERYQKGISIIFTNIPCLDYSRVILYPNRCKHHEDGNLLASDQDVYTPPPDGHALRP